MLSFEQVKNQWAHFLGQKNVKMKTLPHGQIFRFFGIGLIKMYLICSKVPVEKSAKSLHPTESNGPHVLRNEPHTVC